jgi:hypothetical protein
MIELKENFMMSLAAPRGSGKSFLIATLLETPSFLRRFDHVIIMSCSVNLNGDYEQFIQHPKFTFFDEINDGVVDELFEKHERCQKQVVRERRMKRRRLKCPRGLVILDDCLDSGILTFKGAVDKLAERGRHVKLSVIVSSQRISGISRGVRINSDYFIIFSPFSVGELEQFTDQFVSRAARKEFRDVITQVFDEDFRFIIVDNTEKSVRRKLKVSTATEFAKGNATLLLIN